MIFTKPKAEKPLKNLECIASHYLSSFGSFRYVLRAIYWASVFDPDCVRLPPIAGQVPLPRSRSSLPAESPGSSQLVVGIDQSSRGCSECMACEATSVHFRLPCAQGASSALHSGLWNRQHWWICSMGPPALVVLTTKAFRKPSSNM
jgi:hypothetical protein